MHTLARWSVVRRQIDGAFPLLGQNDTAIPVITDQNTLNTTVAPPSSSYRIFPAAIAGGQLPLSLVNNFPTNGTLNAYITGLDTNGRLVMVQSNGQFYYPTTDSAVPVPITDDLAIPLGGKGSTITVSLPGWISAGRIWISEGSLQFFVVESQANVWSLVEPSVVAPNDPNVEVCFGFVELTNDENLGLFVNISLVDFVGLALGIAVTSGVSGDGTQASGQTSSTQTVGGLSLTSAAQICSSLEAQASIDGQPWDKLCINSTNNTSLTRILSPSDYISINPSAFSDYWTSNLDQVWELYSSQPLIINTQSSPGNVSCSISGDQLNCEGDNRSYPKPTAGDIFGCNTGTFSILSTDNDIHKAIVPRLCAAINRSTLLLQGGDVQPGLTYESYYTVSPTNYYSKFVHDYEAGGIGYAFSYDDVAPDGGVNQSGLLLSTDPTALVVNVQGGP